LVNASSRLGRAAEGALVGVEAEGALVGVEAEGTPVVVVVGLSEGDKVDGDAVVGDTVGECVAEARL
jgi:hypothetical protein